MGVAAAGESSSAAGGVVAAGGSGRGMRPVRRRVEGGGGLIEELRGCEGRGRVRDAVRRVVAIFCGEERGARRTTQSERVWLARVEPTSVHFFFSFERRAPLHAPLCSLSSPSMTAA